MSERIKLFVVTHKSVERIPEGRTLIGVGEREALEGVDIYDNTGENIAKKNHEYCELTALYWMWKNVQCSVIGLEHYRRFFCSENIFKASPLKKGFIEKKLKKYDAILPRPSRTRCSVYDYYAKEHYKDDLDICLNIIKAKYPDYCEAANSALKSKKACMTNMFIMPKPLTDEYCAWLFDILSEAEKLIDTAGRDAYQRRVFGFLSERLFNVWLYKKNLKVYYARYYDINDIPWLKKVRGLCRRIKNLFKNQR